MIFNLIIQDIKSKAEDEKTIKKLKFLSLIFLVIILAFSDIASATASITQVHFIDVGQADSILIKNSSGAMLIDGGNNADAELVKNYIKNQGISKLDYIVATHPHEDHIGGLDTVVYSYAAAKILMPKISHTTKTFEDFIGAIAKRGLKATAPIPGTTYTLGTDKFTILAPNSSFYKDINNYSIVIKYTHGSNTILLTGDAESLSESQMLSGKFNLKADLLKVGHHGSSSSTSTAFLDAVSPKYAVISVGSGNSYGHPATTTLSKLAAKSVSIYRTDKSGTIVATCNGSSITFNRNPSVNLIMNSKKSLTVYITKSGAKYHQAGCRYLSRSCIPISMTSAKSQGYMPCSVCNPPH